MTEQKVTLKPVAGDALLIGKYQSGVDRKGKPVFRSMPKGKEPSTIVEAVFEDGRVRSKEGDVFEVRLNKRPTVIKTKQGEKALPAQWITVA
ncbi:hypothetical protein FDJ19_gp088 [Vibrio phage Ceto]|uniref:Uncharacterized protein n=1 Tax=Vibrio phage Ceto TaxID=2570300 RepID=A0A2H5BGH6_9CAUD|nr:hypothetical protein FDJ19_gp088 [Vibrio phage Ceto]AUG85095.1 hypothetical protein CETO_88 [Vibrio phage Ceto]